MAIWQKQMPLTKLGFFVCFFFFSPKFRVEFLAENREKTTSQNST